MGFLSEECQENLGAAQSIYSGVLKAVVDGSIEVRVLNLVLANKDSFLKLSKYTDNSVIPQSGIDVIDKCGVLGKILDWRKQEFDSIERVFRQVAHLRTMCKMLQRGKCSLQII